MMDKEIIEKEEQKIFELLHKVIDPELNVNIVDLGLVYEIHYKEEEILVIMTLTTKGCPLGDTIFNDIENTVGKDYPDMEVNVKLTWEPEWSPDLMTEAGQAQLNQIS